MTEQNKANIFDIVIKPFLCPNANNASQGTGNLFAEAIRTLTNTALLAQRDAHLGCEQYERSADRNGQRNGFKHRTVRTSTGKITLDVPQVRNSETPFQPIIPGFEQGKRVDRALNLAIAEMHLQGVSTRKIAKVMQEICGGNGVSASYVSQCTTQLDELDELFEKWGTRHLPPIAHLFLDATYTKARLNGVIADCAVFLAVGIEAETGRRIVLGVSVGLSEAAEHWSTFIQSLIMRGMNRPLTVTSDDHMGIRAALARTLTGVLWQRCQFHFQQHAQAYVTSSRYKTLAAAHIRTIFNAGSRNMADIMISNVLSVFRADGQNKLTDWLENNVEECLTVIDCPPEVQKRLRTSNIMESINRQLKRRTNVISIFPSEASLLRIITAKAMDLSDEWEGISGKAYISPEMLQLSAEALQAASSQPQNPAAHSTPENPILSQSLADFLIQTMNQCSTGQNRLKSGFLGTAVAFAHKTGSSGVVNGRTLAHNDIGIIQMPGGSYACIVSFISDSIQNESQMNECHSKLGRQVYNALMIDTPGSPPPCF